jgi:hypothetical protein
VDLLEIPERFTRTLLAGGCIHIEIGGPHAAPVRVGAASEAREYYKYKNCHPIAHCDILEHISWEIPGRSGMITAILLGRPQIKYWRFSMQRKSTYVDLFYGDICPCDRRY